VCILCANSTKESLNTYTLIHTKSQRVLHTPCDNLGSGHGVGRGRRHVSFLFWIAAPDPLVSVSATHSAPPVLLQGSSVVHRTSLHLIRRRACGVK